LGKLFERDSVNSIGYISGHDSGKASGNILGYDSGKGPGSDSGKGSGKTKRAGQGDFFALGLIRVEGGDLKESEPRRVPR
jgi:hypothetical protein